MVPSYEQLRGHAPPNLSGSIYQTGTEMVLYEDFKARRIGDILTVLLVEETSGQNSSDNSLNQSTEVNVAAPTFGGSVRPNMNVSLGSENAFNGQSGSSQSNRLNGSIAVTVHEVLPNGNLVVQGEKRIRINQGDEYIRLRGVVRTRDIDPFNMLYSTQVADARITYAGRGTNSHNTTPGWAAKILFSPLWPF
jgi:flagellar L-ring protein precursor FlgH